MTTHFTSGVTNVTADSTFGKVKAPDPTKYHMYHNDFDTYLASDWTITTTEGGSGNASEALGDGDGGLLVITNDDADDDNDFLQRTSDNIRSCVQRSCVWVRLLCETALSQVADC